MSEILLELLSEEIPARMQNNAKISCQKIADEVLAKYFDNLIITTFVTPRRLTLMVENLPEYYISLKIEKKGPVVDAKIEAINGFIKSCGVSSKDDLSIKTIDNSRYYFYELPEQKKYTSEMLPSILGDIIKKLEKIWEKSIIWNDSKDSWVRPVRNILCVFDGKVLDINYFGLFSSNKTFGHRFLANNKEVTIKSVEDYKKHLKDNFVVLDSEERRYIIEERAMQIAEQEGFRINDDQALINEVTGLCEYPIVLQGKIAQEFMNLPKEVLITSMKNHQRYLSMLDENGDLAPFFIVVANNKTENNCLSIIEGNEKVLCSRLNDAKFFYENDTHKKLSERVELLKNIIFHKNIGSIYDKIVRMKTFAKFLSIWVPLANIKKVDEAVLLAKTDLTCGMVSEFPELQGIMGYYYAIHEKYDEEIACSIKDHYLPRDAGDYCPKNPISVVVSLSDKIDSLTGLFLAGERATGSKDPYALRRLAIAIIRVIIENEISVSIKLLISRSLKTYQKKLIAKNYPNKKYNEIIDSLTSEIIEFLIDRLKFMLKNKGIKYDVINSVFFDVNADNLDIFTLVRKAVIVNDFLQTEDGIKLRNAYKRVANITAKSEKEYGKMKDKRLHSNTFKDEYAKKLFLISREKNKVITNLLKKDDFLLAINELMIIMTPANLFLDNVVINVKDKAIAKNRLLLLFFVKKIFDKVVNFSLLEG